MGGARQSAKAGGPQRWRKNLPDLSQPQKNHFEIPPGDDWVDIALKLHYISCMIDKKLTRPRESAAGALASWESEGGTPQPKSESDRETRTALAKEEEHVLCCLGAAVIMQWNDLPTQIQRDLFDHAISVGDPRHTAQLKEQIARFLHTHKNDELGKVRNPLSR
jgi:hypothetical protein